MKNVYGGQIKIADIRIFREIANQGNRGHDVPIGQEYRRCNHMAANTRLRSVMALGFTMALINRTTRTAVIIPGKSCFSA